MANNQNLKPAQPGEIRNPKGKPKGTLNRATLVKRLLETLVKDGDPDEAAIRKALKLNSNGK